MRRVPRLPRWLLAGGSLALLLATATGTTPAQALTLPGPPTGILHTTYGAPAMVATNSAIVIAAADNHGNIDSWYQAYGTTSWTFQRVATAAGGVFYNSPVIAALPGSVAIAAVDTGGGLDYWQQSGNLDTWWKYTFQAGWPPPSQAAAASSKGSYSSVSVNYNLDMVPVTAIAGGQLLTWYQAPGTSQWTADPVPGTGIQSAAATISSSGFEIAAAGPAGAVDTWSESAPPAGWQGPVALAGTLFEPSVTYSVNGLSLAARDASGSLWSAYPPVVTEWFSDEIVSSSMTGHTYSSPSTAETGSARYVSAIDNDGDLDFWSQSGSGPWVADPVAAAT
jgi:hypothetical protein